MRDRGHVGLSAAATAALMAAAFITNIAVALIVLGAMLGAASFVLWVRNSHNLSELNRLLADKAHTGHQALGSDGA